MASSRMIGIGTPSIHNRIPRPMRFPLRYLELDVAGGKLTPGPGHWRRTTLHNGRTKRSLLPARVRARKRCPMIGEALGWLIPTNQDYLASAAFLAQCVRLGCF